MHDAVWNSKMVDDVVFDELDHIGSLDFSKENIICLFREVIRDG